MMFTQTCSEVKPTPVARGGKAHNVIPAYLARVDDLVKRARAAWRLAN